LHAVNHSLTKGGLFLTSGNILSLFNTKSIRRITGLAKSHPAVSWLWVIGFLAISGTPLFGIFVSEFNLLGMAVLQNRLAVAALFLFLLTVIFIAMAASVLPMVQGTPQQNAEEKLPAVLWLMPLLLFLLTGFLGVHIPAWLDRLIAVGAAELGGVR